MTRNARLIKSFETARNWVSERRKGAYVEGYQVTKEEAFQKILPKNIKPEKVKIWRLVLGLDARSFKL